MRRLYIIDNLAWIFAECENKDDAFRMWKEMLLNNEWRSWYLDIVILLDDKIEYEVSDWEVVYYIWSKEIDTDDYIKKGVIEVGTFEFKNTIDLKKLLYINIA